MRDLDLIKICRIIDNVGGQRCVFVLSLNWHGSIEKLSVLRPGRRSYYGFTSSELKNRADPASLQLVSVFSPNPQPNSANLNFLSAESDKPSEKVLKLLAHDWPK